MKPELIAALKYAAACQRLTASNLAGAYEIQTAAMADELDSQRATISRLLRYAYHEEECAVMTCCGDLPPCDCGYDEIMKELEEAR